MEDILHTCQASRCLFRGFLRAQSLVTIAWGDFCSRLPLQLKRTRMPSAVYQFALRNSLVPFYTPGWRGTLWVKRLAQEQNTTIPTRTWTTKPSGHYFPYLAYPATPPYNSLFEPTACSRDFKVVPVSLTHLFLHHGFQKQKFIYFAFEIYFIKIYFCPKKARLPSRL